MDMLKKLLFCVSECSESLGVWVENHLDVSNPSSHKMSLLLMLLLDWGGNLF